MHGYNFWKYFTIIMHDCFSYIYMLWPDNFKTKYCYKIERKKQTINLIQKNIASKFKGQNFKHVV